MGYRKAQARAFCSGSSESIQALERAYSATRTLADSVRLHHSANVTPHRAGGEQTEVLLTGTVFLKGYWLLLVALPCDFEWQGYLYLLGTQSERKLFGMVSHSTKPATSVD